MLSKEQDSYNKESMLYRFQVQQGEEPTLHAGLLSSIQQLVLSTDQTINREQVLKLKYHESHICPSISSPFPYSYYQSLLKAVNQLVRSADLAAERVNAEWTTLVKLALYMSLKRIPIDRYGKCFFMNDNRQQLSSIPFYRFSSIYCRQANFYCFFSLGSAITQMRQIMQKKLISLDQHFKAIDNRIGIGQIGQKEFLDLLDRQQQKVQNYFLQRCPSKQEWEAFLANLQGSGVCDTFCQVIILAEPPHSCYKVNEDHYPLSIESIARAYLEAYNSRKHERLIKDKIPVLRSITAQLNSLKMSPLPRYFKHIYLELHTQKEQPLIQNGVKLILTNESDEQKCYYHLIARFDKLKQDVAKWQLDPTLSALLGLVNPVMPTLHLFS